MKFSTTLRCCASLTMAWSMFSYIADTASSYLNTPEMDSRQIAIQNQRAYVQKFEAALFWYPHSEHKPQLKILAFNNLLSEEVIDAEILKRFIETHHIDINSRQIFPSIAPLNAAARSKNLEFLKYILKKWNRNVNRKDIFGLTPFMNACRVFWIEGMEYLIQEEDVNIDAQDMVGNTALMYVIKCDCESEDDRIKVIHYLVKNAKVNLYLEHGSGKIAAEIAVEPEYKQRPEVIALLLGAWVENINVQHQSHYGKRLFFEAVREGHLDIVQYFIEKLGVSPNIKEENGNTPLMLTVRHPDRMDLVDYLVNGAGADMDIKNRDENTALQIAENKKNVDMVYFLMKLLNNKKQNLEK